MNLEISEIFGPTIQGEGKYTGRISVFIRFGRCNMSCKGFKTQYETPSGIKKFGCDSFYASDQLFHNKWKVFKSAQCIIEKVDTILKDAKYDIVITGGEPLLYWNNVEFQKLLEYYINKKHKLTIETNASLNISFKKQWQSKIIFSMSIKLSNSLESFSKRINIETLVNIINSSDDCYVKFVINREFLSKTQEEIDNILSIIPNVQVYLMPLGDTTKELENNGLAAANMAIENGFNYSDRLHIRLWNNKIGV